MFTLQPEYCLEWFMTPFFWVAKRRPYSYSSLSDPDLENL